MATPAKEPTSLQFGAFEVDLASQEIFRRGMPLHLQGKPFQILALLLERPGEILTREELQQRLWPEGTFVDFDRNLNTAIKKLRQALGDSAETPAFIETLPRRGYRFIAPVRIAGNGHAAEQERVDPPASNVSISTQSSSSKRIPWFAGGLIVALAIAIVAIKFIPARRALDVREMRMVKTTQNLNIHAMAVSPNGLYLAYAISDGLRQSLWIRELSGTNALQLLPAETVNFSGISFSPDGDLLYFVRSEKTNPVFGFMCRMPAHGGKVEELIRDADSSPSFSPDGNRFVYTRGYPQRNATQVRIADRDGAHDYALVELDGHQVEGAAATWSPNGAKIAVPIHIVGDQSKFVLKIISLSNGKVEEVFSSQGDIGRPLWLSDSNLLLTLYSGGARGGQLWTLSYPGGAAERFTNDLTNYSSTIDISSDHRKVAALVSGITSSVWVAPAEDISRPVQLTSGGPSPLRVRELADGRIAMLVIGVELSPDKTRAPSDGRTASLGTAVWTMNIDGAHRVPWPEVQAPESIEPCGQGLLALENKDGNSILLRHEPDGSAPQALASGDVLAPICAPDGKFIYYLNFAHPEKIRRTSNDGGSVVPIADVLGDTLFGALAVSPDGKLLAYPFQRYSPPRVAIAVIPAAGGPPLQDFTIPGFSEMLRWSPDGRSLQYLLTSEGATNLWEQPLNNTKPRQLTHFTAGQIFDFTWTRDGKHLLLVRGELNSDLVLIEDPR